MAKRKNQKKNHLVAIVLILIMLISIGYAFLSTTLNINGTANISAAQWSVYFNNVQIKEGSVTATTAPTVPENSKTTTTLTYEVNMSTPGEFYEFTADVVNDGTIDAMLDKLEVSTLNETQAKYLDYVVTYADDEEIGKNGAKDLLKSKETETIKVGLYFKTEINAADLPTENDTITATVEMNYVQADDTAVARPKFELSAANYGDKINYSVDVNGVTLDTWSLFYEENGTAYMMYDGYLPNAAINTTATKLQTFGTYRAYWKDYTSTLTGSGNYNQKAVDRLNDTTAWNQLLSIDLKAKDSTAEARGAIDLEKWVASWNAKGEIEGTSKYPKLYTAQNLTGYFIGTSANPSSYYVDNSSAEGYNDKLYYPYKSAVSDSGTGGNYSANFYWLASPSADDTDYVVFVYYNGCVDSNGVSSDLGAVRPVISLKSNILVPGTEAGTLDIK